MSFEVPGGAYDRSIGRYSVRLAPLFAGVAPEMRVLDVGAVHGRVS